MKVSIFIPCFNEARILRQTIEHYRMCFSDPSFTIFDNYSTDDSVNIAKDLGCTVHSWSSNNTMSEHQLLEIRNKAWKEAPQGWVIVCDMDEWLNIDDESLQKEEASGTTILHIQGCDMIGESQKESLEDIDLHSITKCTPFDKMNKNICFDTRFIKDINFVFGAHKAAPEGDIRYSQKTYVLKHMDLLGLPYKMSKNKARYERNEEMRRQNLNNHYITDMKQLEETYRTKRNAAKDIQYFFDNLNLAVTKKERSEIKSSCKEVCLYIFCLHDVSITRKTIMYYKELFPKATMTLYVHSITKEMTFFTQIYPCNIIVFPEIYDPKERTNMKNHCWKSVSSSWWVFLLDDDEWLGITEKELFCQELWERTVIKSIEYSPQEYSPEENKSRYVGFHRKHIFDINYTIDGSLDDPVGIVQFSTKDYVLKRITPSPSPSSSPSIPNTNKYKILVFMADNRSLYELFYESDYHSLATAINYAYCVRQGYDFQYVQTCYKYKDTKKLYNCVDPSTKKMRHAAWSKLLVTQSLLERAKDYDYIVYIDTDCIFYNQFIPLDNIINEHKDKDFIFYNNKPFRNPHLPSSGFFICRVNDTVKQMVKRWYEFDVSTLSQEKQELCLNVFYEQQALWEIYMDMNIAILDIPMYELKSENQYLCHVASNLKVLRLPCFQKFILSKHLNYTLLINKLYKEYVSVLDTSLFYTV